MTYRVSPWFKACKDLYFNLYKGNNDKQAHAHKHAAVTEIMLDYTSHEQH